jgi:hypothetical protein
MNKENKNNNKYQIHIKRKSINSHNKNKKIDKFILLDLVFF